MTFKQRHKLWAAALIAMAVGLSGLGQSVAQAQPDHDAVASTLPHADRLATLVPMAAKAEQLAAELEKQGKLDAYANMRRMLITRFMYWLGEDVKYGRKEIAAHELAGMEQLLPESLDYFQKLADGKVQPTAVPKRVATELPQVRGTQIYQSVVWPDGRIEKDRPIFLFGFGHFGTMRQDIKWLGQLGINYTQSEIGPSFVYPKPNEWNQPLIDEFHKYVEDANSEGVLVDLLLSPHYMPEWQFERHPNWRAPLGGFVSYPLENPDINAFLAGTTKRILQSFTDTPNVWSICVANEPVAFKWDYDRVTSINMWKQYLVAKYGNIANVNKRWKTTYASFDQIPWYGHPPTQPYAPEPALYDWMRFTDQRHANWLKFLSDSVTRLDPNKVTHVKMLERSYGQYDLLQGVDVPLVAGIGKIAGTDASVTAILKVLHAKRVESPAHAMALYSMIRSSSHRPINDTENHILADGQDSVAIRNYTAASFWLEAISGLNASTAWTWDRVNSTNSPFYGLFPHQPKAMEEYMRTGLDFMRLMPQIVTLSDMEPRVAVVYSKTTMLRNSDGSTCLFDTYQTLSEAGIPTVVITEQTLADPAFHKQFPRVKVLVLPKVTHLSDEAWSGMIDYLHTYYTTNEAAIINIGDGTPPKDPYCFDRSTNIFTDTQIASRQIDGNLPYEEAGKQLVTLLERFNVKAEIRAVDPKTGELIPGVIFRYSDSNPPMGFVVNLLKTPVRVQWRTTDGKVLKQLNLVALPIGAATDVVDLPSLEVHMGPLTK